MKFWDRYEQLRPDELAELVRAAPVAYWPLGLLEHHGWHLPVGFDGIKADRICIRMAERTGGVVLPVMWWGGLGGHGEFMWTLYQSAGAARDIAVNTIEHLVAFGFRAIVLLMGHYPWEAILKEDLPALRAKYPHVLLIGGTEASIAPELGLGGDHAAREETSYGLAVLPELVDMTALRPGHDNTAWPNGQPPNQATRHPGVIFDPGGPLFAQYGEDARLASAERGETGIARLVDYVAARITAHLGEETVG